MGTIRWRIFVSRDLRESKRRPVLGQAKNEPDA